jgi:hypothetical protein
MIKRYFLYGLLGWNIEIIWTGLFSLLSGDLRLIGFTNLWMLFVYGLAVFLEPIHNIIRQWHWFFRGMIWVVIIWGIEYASGLILMQIIGDFPWTYGGPFTVDRLVRLDYAPAWFVAGLLFERIHNAFDGYKVS